MNEITTKLKELETQTLSNVRSSKANNTLKAYKSDFRDFKVFITTQLKSMPSTPENPSIYLTSLSKKCKLSTLKEE